MFKNIQRVKLLSNCLIAILIVFYCGCASVDRQASSTLASAGINTSTATQVSIKDIRNNLEIYIEGLYLLEPLTGKPLLSLEKLKEITDVSKALALRLAVLGELSKSYTAFEALASYNASQEVESAVNGLTTAINEYANTVNPGSRAISDVPAALADRGFGLFAKHKQSKLLKLSSQEIRKRLSKFVKLMEKEKQLYNAISDVIVVGKGETAKALWDKGIGIPSPIFKQHIGSFGLEFDSNLFPNVISEMDDSDQEKMKNAITNVIDRRVIRRMELQKAVINSSIAALKSLITAHEKLERGEPITLQSLRTNTLAIRQFVEEISRLRSAE